MEVDDLIKPKIEPESKKVQPFSYRPAMIVAVVLVLLATGIYVYKIYPRQNGNQTPPIDLNELERNPLIKIELTPEEQKVRGEYFANPPVTSGELTPEQIEQRNKAYQDVI